MSDKTVSSVFAKPLDLPGEILDFEGRERILRREELGKLSEVENYERHLTVLWKKDRKELEGALNKELHERHRKLESESVEQMTTAIRGFHQAQERYLASMEQQCKSIVSHAFMALVGEVPDEKKLSSLVRRAVVGYAGEASAILGCHPSQEGLLKTYKLPDHWTVKSSEQIQINTLRLKVPLGEYAFSFQASLDAFHQLFTR